MISHEITIKKLEDLKGAPYNPREISDDSLEGLSNSLSEFGLVQPIVWNKRSGYIVGGHQRVKALLRAGETQAQVLVVDLDEGRERALNLALNNPNIEGEFTNEVYGLLDSLQQELPDLFQKLHLDDIATFKRRDIRSLVGEADVRGSESADLYAPDVVVEEAFEYFRRAGFPYPHLEPFEIMQEFNKLANLPEESCIRSTAGYQIADTFHGHRFHAAAINMGSPYEGFMDDKILKHALRLEYNGSRNIKKGWNGPMGIARGTQMCSNFRPAFAKMIYNRYCPKDGKIFDPSTGYGGRLVGFLASHAGIYCGSDPNTPTYDANVKLSQLYGKHKRVKLFKSPFEDLKHPTMDWAGEFDLCFTSPPYFKKELYSKEATNSCNRYPEYPAWRDGFLSPLMRGCHSLLRAGGLCLINIADVRIGEQVFPLEHDTVECGRAAGLRLKETLSFPMAIRMHWEKKSDLIIEEQAEEAVFIFEKIA